MKTAISLSAITLLSTLAGLAGAASLEIRDHETGQVVTGTTIRHICDDSGKAGYITIDRKLTLVNTSSKEIKVGAKKVEPHALQADVAHNFCFAGLCYPSYVFVSPEFETLAPGQSDQDLESGFKGTYNYDNAVHVQGVDRVAYVFYDENNPSDSAILYVEYDTRKGAGIGNTPGRNRSFSIGRSQIAPGRFGFKVTGLSDRFGPLTYNLAGVSGEKFPLAKVAPEKDGLSLETGKLSPGVYFLSIINGKRVLGSERFMVGP